MYSTTARTWLLLLVFAYYPLLTHFLCLCLCSSRPPIPFFKPLSKAHANSQSLPLCFQIRRPVYINTPFVPPRALARIAGALNAPLSYPISSISLILLVFFVSHSHYFFDLIPPLLQSAYFLFPILPILPILRLPFALLLFLFHFSHILVLSLLP
jgi:hypothetical protein